MEQGPATQSDHRVERYERENIVTECTVRADDAIDLQMHTVHSDGRWTPAELFEYLASEQFRVVAVTDHDNMDALDEIVSTGAARGVHVIPAVEVSTEWRGLRTDLLCFARDFTGDALRNLIRNTKRRQLENTLAVHDELRRRGYAFARQAAVLRGQGGEPVRPIDNATLLHAHGYVATMSEALSLIEDAGYTSVAVDLAEAVRAAHASDAVALIAHPGRRERPFTTFEIPMLDAIAAEIPLDGIEVQHPSHSPEQVVAYETYVKQRGWLQSAGSDSHGAHQRLPIAYPAALARHLLQRCGVSVLE